MQIGTTNIERDLEAIRTNLDSQYRMQRPPCYDARPYM